MGWHALAGRVKIPRGWVDKLAVLFVSGCPSQRSATAAQEIGTLIAESARQVDEGARLVGAAGGTMGEIVQPVQQVTAIIAELSAAAREQSTGLGQMGEAVNPLDQMTQQNAALVEESSAATPALR